jgi:hypothetical protein
MRIYLAGTPGILERERNWWRFIKRRLYSYWDIQQKQFSVDSSFHLLIKE